MTIILPNRPDRIRLDLTNEELEVLAFLTPITKREGELRRLFKQAWEDQREELEQRRGHI